MNNRIKSLLDEGEPYSDTYDYTYEVKDGYVIKITEVYADGKTVYMIIYQP